MSSEKGYIRDNFLRGSDEDRFMYQNGGGRALPSSLMLGKAIIPFAGSSNSAYRPGVGDERASENDERAVYEAALQVLLSACQCGHCICIFNSLDSQNCMKKIFCTLNLSGNNTVERNISP